ncbi:MAG: hypothetical protein KC912_22180 [Proteobacteria bacterium]|nr:hypothetical protein [Pseudomonadota bacterium]
MRIALILAITATLIGCDNFSAVQKADTIEAYETYIADNPESRMMLQADTRLQELYLKKAKEDGTLEGYDAYVQKFPEGIYVEKAMKEREEFLWTWAKAEDNEAGWTKYLEEYPRADKKKKKEARQAIAMDQYRGKLTLTDPRIERVNLAEDPEGDKNGWGIWVDVTNGGEKTIQDLRLRATFFEGDDKLGDALWPVVAKNWGVPMEEEKKVPMKPGETRTWFWMDASPEESWGQKVTIVPARITYVEEE